MLCDRQRTMFTPSPRWHRIPATTLRGICYTLGPRRSCQRGVQGIGSCSQQGQPYSRPIARGVRDQPGPNHGLSDFRHRNFRNSQVSAPVLFIPRHEGLVGSLPALDAGLVEAPCHDESAEALAVLIALYAVWSGAPEAPPPRGPTFQFEDVLPDERNRGDTGAERHTPAGGQATDVEPRRGRPVRDLRGIRGAVLPDRADVERAELPRRRDEGVRAHGCRRGQAEDFLADRPVARPEVTICRQEIRAPGE